MSGGTTSTILRNLLSDMPYTVTVVPVYPEGEGLRQSDNEKTRESHWNTRTPEQPGPYRTQVMRERHFIRPNEGEQFDRITSV